MILFLLIFIFFLFLLLLILNLITSKKNEKFKFSLRPNYIKILIIIIIALVFIRYLPKILTFFPNIQVLLSPLFNILKTIPSPCFPGAVEHRNSKRLPSNLRKIFPS